MKNTMNISAARLVSVGQIAEIANVSSSAVSNWRSRHSDFPLPIEKSGMGDLFDLDGVIQWLTAHGKNFQQPQVKWDTVLWKAFDRFRGELEADDFVLLLLQLLVLRADLEHHNGDGRSKLWVQLKERPAAPLDVWARSIDEIQSDDFSLGRALVLPSRVEDKHLWDGVDVVRQLDDPEVDFGALATGVLQQYQEAQGIRGSESSTGGISALQVALLRPIKGTVYDPACGVATVLAEAWRQRATEDIKLVGQEVHANHWRLAFLHLALNRANFAVESGDTFRDDRFQSLRADRIAADPPLAGRISEGGLSRDERWSFGVPRRSPSWLWAQVAIYHLAEDGMAVVSMPPGSLSRGGSEELIRRGVLKADLLDAVINLPPGLAVGTSMPVSLLVFSRNRAGRSERVLFIDARQLGKPRRGKVHELSSADIERIAEAVKAWRSGEFQEEPRFSAEAEVSAILNGGADLSPNRYVNYSTPVSELHGEPIPDRIARLHQEAAVISSEIGAATHRAIQTLSSFSEEAAERQHVRLGDLLLDGPTTGRRQDAEGTEAEVPYVSTELISGGARRIHKAPKEVTRGKVRERLARRGDLLIVSRGIDADTEVGCAVVDYEGEVAYAESLLRISPNPQRIDADYLRLFLTSHQGRRALVAATTGSVIANLRSDALEEIDIPLPDRETQNEIVVRMRRVEDGVKALDDSRRALEDAFDALREGIISGVYVP